MTKLDVSTLNGKVLDLLRKAKKRDEWYMPHEIRSLILRYHDKFFSESGISARIRDLRKDRYGAHTISKRRREGSTGYEYKLVSR